MKIILIVVLLLGVNTQAGTYWYRSQAGNWSSIIGPANSLPNADNIGIAQNSEIHYDISSETMNQLYLGQNITYSGPATLNMDTGILTVTAITVGRNHPDNDGFLNMYGGNLTAGIMYVASHTDNTGDGSDPDGTLTYNSGTIMSNTTHLGQYGVCSINLDSIDQIGTSLSFGNLTIYARNSDSDGANSAILNLLSTSSGYSHTPGNAYTLMTYTGLSGEFSNLSDGDGVTIGGDAFQIDYGTRTNDAIRLRAVSEWLDPPYDPSVDLQSDPSLNATLHWKAAPDPDGVYVVNPDVLVHYVYMSLDQSRTPDTTLYYQGQIPAASLSDPSASSDVFVVDYDGQYNWKIEEGVNDGMGNPYPPGHLSNIHGPIWSFQSVSSTLDIEHFMYNDTADLRGSWTVDVASGSTVTQNAFYGAMELNYDNRVWPWKSEVGHSFDTVQDWSLCSGGVLRLSVLGDSANVSGDLYVTLDDGDGPVEMLCLQPDAVTTDVWRDYQFRLDDFVEAGVDLSAVEKCAVGVKKGQAAGGQGDIGVDAIIVSAHEVCFNWAREPADLNGDCRVGMPDLTMLATDWLLQDFTVSASAVGPAGLVAHYAFEENHGTAALDTSGNNHHAAVAPGAASGYWVEDGYAGRCIEVREDLEIQLPASVFSDIDSQATISFWASEQSEQADFLGGPVPGVDELHYWGYLAWNSIDSKPYTKDWSHYAFVKDTHSQTLKIYYNGKLMAAQSSVSNVLEGNSAGQTTIKLDRPGLEIRVDELEIYNQALSQEEVIYRMIGEDNSVIQPVWPLYTDAEIVPDGIIDLNDIAEMAINWLEK